MDRRSKSKNLPGSPRPDDLRRRVLLKNFFREQTITRSDNTTPSICEESILDNENVEPVAPKGHLVNDQWNINVSSQLDEVQVLPGTSNNTLQVPVLSMSERESSNMKERENDSEEETHLKLEENCNGAPSKLKRKFSLKRPYSFTRKAKKQIKLSNVVEPFLNHPKSPKRKKMARNTLFSSPDLNNKTDAPRKKSKTFFKKLFKSERSNSNMSKHDSNVDFSKLQFDTFLHNASVQTDPLEQDEREALIKENNWLRREVNHLLQSNYYLRSVNNNLHMKIEQNNCSHDRPVCSGNSYESDNRAKIGRSKSIQESRNGSRHGCRRVKSVHVTNSNNFGSNELKRVSFQHIDSTRVPLHIPRIPLQHIESTSRTPLQNFDPSREVKPINFPENGSPPPRSPPRYETRMYWRLNRVSSF